MRNKKSYVGSTDNVDRRLKEHNAGNSIYTKRYRPWQMMYFERFGSKKEAVEKEKYYKTRIGRKRLKELFSQDLPGRLTVGQ